MSLDVILFSQRFSSVNKLLLNVEFSEVFCVPHATENVLRGYLGDGLQKRSVRMCLIQPHRQGPWMCTVLIPRWISAPPKSES